MTHPSDETLGAFLEGTLDPRELSALSAHLRDCDECRLIVAESARFEREEPAAAPAGRRWLPVAAALVIAAIIAVPALRWNANRRGTVAYLAAKAPREHRRVESRLSGFRWAALQPPSRGAAQADPADLKLAGVAGTVLEATAASTTPEAQHARGDALLLIGRRAEAVAALEQAAQSSNDAPRWNDLAAARYAQALEDDRPSQLPFALAAADRARALDPKSPEAGFNRALILERMGLRARAREAWQEYLSIDAGSEWAAEARAHLRALGNGAERFEERFFDSLAPAALARQFPENARRWGEGPLLAAWSAKPSEEKLARLRAIGAALGEAHHEHMLADAVAAIDAAPPAVRATLAEGHRLYNDGGYALSHRQCAHAEGLLRQAEERFRTGKSPMWVMAAHFRAAAAFCQHRLSDAEASLQQLRSTVDAGRYPAAAAQIDWSLAVGQNAAGDWASGARTASAASKTYAALGETNNAAATEGVAAHALDVLGASDPAWSHWIHALGALDTPRGRARRGTMLRDAALALARFHEPAAAASVLDAAIPDLAGDPAQRAAALTERARVSEWQDDGNGARQALAEAREAAGHVSDAALHDVVTAPIEVAAASLIRRSDPHAAIAALDRAIAFFQAGNLRRTLPEALLERARAHRAAGDWEGAKDDYAAAFAEVESQMASVDGAELRLRFIDTAAQVVEESIELHLARGEPREAFAIAEQARELPGTVHSQPSPDTAVIEYAVLPHGLAAFVLADGTLSETSVTIGRAALAEQIAALSAAMQRRAASGEIRAAAGGLYRLLIAPHRSRIARATQLVVVPDRELYALPFAALYDDSRGEYLAEQFTLRLAPSASAAGENEPAPLSPALVVADPAVAAEPRLVASRDEGTRIAAMYGATLLAGEDATRPRFLDGLSNASLIHYAAHAESDTGALLLAGRGGETAIVSSAAIARLQLTRHPLVVLAACGTFRGDARHAAGMPSVARAFLLAGARSVVATLWEVDDDVAAALFLRFHQQLAAGAAPAAALQAAQRALLHGPDGRLANPASWAPIIVVERKTGGASVGKERRQS